MKIVLINNVPEIWGLGKYSFKLYESLNKKADVVNFYMDFENKKVVINGKSIKLPKSFLLYNKISFIWMSMKYLPEAEIYHLTSQNLSFIIPIIKNKYKKAKMVVSCHDIYRYKKPKNSFYFLISKFLYSGLKKADAIISSTNSTKIDLVKYFKIDTKKIYTVNLASDNLKKIDKKLARKKLGLPLNSKLIMHIGRIGSNWKNTYRTIKAVESLKNKNLFLIKIGEGEDKSPNVINLYKVSDEEMVLLYNASDLLAAILTYDITSLPIMEAIKNKLPVVASKTSSIVEISGNAPYYVNAFDTEGIAKGIKLVLEDKKLRQSMIKKGLEIGKELTWENTAKQTLEIYKRIKNYD
ncbi:MAG: glycosyltransferase [Nanoarchaeota archaeon]|nr:glycosyltransferase [Nanoarchaeota archaeon]